MEIEFGTINFCMDAQGICYAHIMLQALAKAHL